MTEHETTLEMGTREDRLYLTLCIYHETIDPSVVSERLGIEPTRVFYKGKPSRAGGTHHATSNAWFLSSEGKVPSNEFAAHLGYLMHCLSGKYDQVRSLKEEGYRLELSCYWMTESGLGVIEIPPGDIQQLADLGVWLWFDRY
jgi:hypothetical protein